MCTKYYMEINKMNELSYMPADTLRDKAILQLVEQVNELSNTILVMRGQILDLNKQVTLLKQRDFPKGFTK